MGESDPPPRDRPPSGAERPCYGMPATQRRPYSVVVALAAMRFLTGMRVTVVVRVCRGVLRPSRLPIPVRSGLKRVVARGGHDELSLA